MATIKKRRWKTSKGEPREAWLLQYIDKNTGQRHKEQFALKREAEDRRDEVAAKIKNEEFNPDADKMTVRELVEAYSKELDGILNRKEATRMYVENTKSQLTRFVVPVIGGVKLSGVTAGAVRKVDHAMRDSEKPVGVPTRRRVVGAMSRMFRWASEGDMMAKNPAKGYSVKGDRAEKAERVTPPSDDEVKAILKAADALPVRRWAKQPPAVALRIRFALASGLRASEQWGLHWGDVHLDERKVMVSRRVDGWGKPDVTKSKAGTRIVPLTEDIAKLLESWRKETRWPGDDQPVFPNAKGGYMTHSSFLREHFAPLIEAAGVDVTWHGFRHRFVSQMLAAGTPVKVVQTWAGHASAQMTLDVYGHFIPSDDYTKYINKIAY